MMPSARRYLGQGSVLRSPAVSELGEELKSRCFLRGLLSLRQSSALASLVGPGLLLALTIPARGGPRDDSARVTGRILEACSCMVPCPCNFGRSPKPLQFCQSLAFFEFQKGSVGGIRLKGLRFAVASRGGTTATLYLDARSSEEERKALRSIGTWILSLERTPVTAVMSAPIDLDFGDSRLSGSVAGTDIELVASPLRGNDGKSAIIVSHPWLFGSFPVSSARKCVAEKLRVRAPSVSFSYAGTNANDALFEFPASAVGLSGYYPRSSQSRQAPFELKLKRGQQ